MDGRVSLSPLRVRHIPPLSLQGSGILGTLLSAWSGLVEGGVMGYRSRDEKKVVVVGGIHIKASIRAEEGVRERNPGGAGQPGTGED